VLSIQVTGVATPSAGEKTMAIEQLQKAFRDAYIAWISVRESDPFFYSKREMLWEEYVRARDALLGEHEYKWPRCVTSYAAKIFA
jgi:hypothetical protein